LVKPPKKLEKGAILLLLFVENSFIMIAIKGEEAQYG